MTVIDALKWRYACKKFNPDKKLSAEQLDLLIQSLNLTPTSQGLQPFKFVVIENNETKESLLEATNFQKQVVDCSHLIIICQEKNITPTFINNYFERVVGMRNLDKSAKNIQGFSRGLHATLEMKEDDLRNWMKNQAYIALGTLMTTCAVLQIDSCPMEGFSIEKYEEILHLDTLGLSPVLVCPVGFRHEEDFFQHYPKVRRSIEDIVIHL
ncbi:MAG: NAD(P)H-dependent oxidoreductase [Crocinitomicaceae bacterium]